MALCHLESEILSTVHLNFRKIIVVLLEVQDIINTTDDIVWSSVWTRWWLLFKKIKDKPLKKKLLAFFHDVLSL